MKREPFVWEIQLIHDVLDDALAELTQLPFEVLRQIAHTPLKKSMRGRDDKMYRLTVTAEQPGGIDGTVGISMHLRRGWFGQTLTHEFTVDPPTEPSVTDDADPSAPPTAANRGDDESPATDTVSDDFSHG